MANKKSSAGSTSHPMVGIDPPGGDVKQPFRGRSVVSGTKLGKSKPKGSKTIQTVNGTSGIMRQPRG